MIELPKHGGICHKFQERLYMRSPKAERTSTWENVLVCFLCRSSKAIEFICDAHPFFWPMHLPSTPGLRLLETPGSDLDTPSQTHSSGY